jgi:predicted permease
MMMIGMILSHMDLRRLVDRTILWFTLHRLVLMPLLVFALCRVLGISSLVTGVSVLLAAMPAGATTTMLSAKYDRDPEFATKLVVFTTLCSIPAIFIWSAVLI